MKLSLTIPEIEAVVCTLYDMPTSDLQKPVRTTKIREARQICMYLSFEMACIIKKDIADYYKKDHSTVIHAITVIEGEITVDYAFARKILHLKKEIMAVGKEIVYISGKITGVADLNQPKFDAAERALRKAGYHVINPHKIVPFDRNVTWKEHMKADIKALMDCHVIALLDDWNKSRGAKIEVKLAKQLGMKMIDAYTLEPLKL